MIDLSLIKFNSQLTPDKYFRFALGIGKPQDIVDLYKIGYTIFDCVLPTRDARHGRLYVFSEDPEKIDILKIKKVHSFLYLNREKYIKDQAPISEYCDCHTCQNYSRAYLHHLFKIEDSLAGRLATIHNLRMYSRVIGQLRDNDK